MRRRLSPEARRAEIIELTQAAITADGYRALSMNEIARRCGMSTPGLLHYFADMPSLLQAVLDHRDAVDIAAIDADTADITVLDALAAARRYYASRPDEIRRFDLLEAEALDPGHPAHDHFRERSDRNFAGLQVRIEREFADPDHVARMLQLLLDGLRVKRLRAFGSQSADFDADWQLILDLVTREPRRADG